MSKPNFKLITIADIKTQYPFLVEDEKFDYFEEWQDDDFFLIAESDIRFDGNFCLDLYEEKEKKWVKSLLKLPTKEIEEIRIEGIFINGDFAVSGSIINAEGDYGPYVFISGTVMCQSFLLGGANVEIKGNIVAKEVVMAYYNHGNFNCSGLIDSPVFIVNDHNTAFAERKNNLFYYNDRADDVDLKNECEYDDETGDEIISGELRKLLDNPLIETFEELERDLARGEWVLKQNNPPVKTYEYWRDRILSNYRDLKLVPKEFKTEELCNLALNITFHALPFIDQDLITAKLCEKLVNKNGFALQKIPDQFITKELCLKAAQSGTLISLIPSEFYSEELILNTFKNGKHEPNINDVPSKFITNSLIEEYVKIGKGLWLDKVCKENGKDKLVILKHVIDSGIQYLDAVFGNHFSKDVVEYAASIYSNEKYKEEWKSCIQKYTVKFKRLGLKDYF